MAQDFFSCDWGTTHFRLAAIEAGTQRVAAETHTTQGVATITPGPVDERPQRFRAVLSAALQQLDRQLGPPFQHAPVAISGMASSSIGWQELPYGGLPLSLDGNGLPWVELSPIDGHPLALFSGLASPRDILRGEETQALGVFQLEALAPLAAGCLLILPGTHSKHLVVADHQLHDFRTFMTGELFAVLSQHSLLRHSVSDTAPAPQSLEGETLASFCDGVEAARQAPLSAALFQVRTRQVLDGQPPQSNRTFLSGLLIGAELAHLTTSSLSYRALVLAAPPALESVYAAAMQALGLSDQVRSLSATEQGRLTAAGQRVLLQQIGWI